VLFIAYSVMLGAIALSSFFLWPWAKFRVKQEYKIVQEEDSSEQFRSIPQNEIQTPLLGQNRDVTIQKNANLNKNSELTYWEQLKINTINLHYFYLVLFIPLMVVSSNFFLATSNQQLDLITKDSSLKNTYAVILAYLLPTIGLVVAPLGLILDRYGINTGIFFFVALSCIGHALGIIRNMPLQIVRFVVFSTYFPYTYTLWADFIVKKFGFSTYGVLFGVVAAVSGVFGFATTALVNFAVTTNQYDWVNIGWILCSILGLIYPVTMLFYSCTRDVYDERDVVMRKSTL